jgi:O-antigen/teichoic acid export membrane protein
MPGYVLRDELNDSNHDAISMKEDSAALPVYRKLKEIQPSAPMPSAKLTEARNRLPTNVLSNMTWLLLNAIVGMWYTPYLISHLGVAVYGLVPLVGSAIGYMTILTEGFNSAVSRFLTIDLAKDNANAANRTFNTTIVGSLIIAAILLPVALVFSWLAPQIFDVPLGYERDMRLLVLFVTVALITTTVAISFSISSYAYHRFDLRLMVNIVRLMTQMGSVVVLFIVLTPRLWQVGVGIFLSSLFFLLGHGVLWRRLMPELGIRLNLFDLPLLKEMLGFSGWVLINQVGGLLFRNIDLIVTNLIFGAEMAGRYGAVTVFPAMLRAMVGTVNGVLVPIVVTLYAQKDLPRLVRLSCRSVKFIGLAVALPVGLFCGLGKPLLTLWLGPEFSDLSWLLVVLIGDLCINLSVATLFALQAAVNKVRVPGLATLVFGVINVALAIALALWSGWGYIGIAVAGTIMLLAKNALFTPLYSARILKLPWWTFLPSMMAGAIGTLAVGTGTYLISLTWTLTSWVQLALVAIITGVIYVSAAYFLGLNTDDRDLVKSEVRRRIKTV